MSIFRTDGAPSREVLDVEIVTDPAADERGGWPVEVASSDLNRVRNQLVTDRLTFGGQEPDGTAPSLYVDPAGNILLREQTAGLPASRLSPVTSKTFYAPDLNRIAATIRENQAKNITDPARSDQQLFVDEKGDILFGDQVDPRSARRVSRVTQETFYSRWEDESAIVEAKLPEGTYFANDGEIDGWVYQITTEFNDVYTMYAWYDQSDATYKVSLIEPRLGGTVGVEDCHIFQDGTICLKREGGPGYRRLEDAYARSALWARGASCYRLGYGFQFNVGQEA